MPHICFLKTLLVQVLFFCVSITWYACAVSRPGRAKVWRKWRPTIDFLVHHLLSKPTPTWVWLSWSLSTLCFFLFLMMMFLHLRLDCIRRPGLAMRFARFIGQQNLQVPGGDLITTVIQQANCKQKTCGTKQWGNSLKKLTLIMFDSFILLRVRLLQAPAKRRSFAVSGPGPWAFHTTVRTCYGSKFSLYLCINNLDGFKQTMD